MPINYTDLLDYVREMKNRGKEFIDLMVDYAPKHLIGSGRNNDILVEFINDTAYLFEKDKVSSLIILNPENLKTYDEDKKSIMDIKVLTRTFRRREDFVNLEFQTTSASNFIKRALYYTSNIYSSQLKEGDDYDKLKRVISLNILSKNLIKDSDEVLNLFELMSKDGLILTDSIKMNFVEISKFDETQMDILNKFHLWVFLFKNSIYIDPNNPPKEYLKYPVFVKLFREMAKMIKEPEKMLRYYERRDLLLEHQFDLEAVREEGKKEGIAIGEKKGKKEGIKTVAKNFRDQGVDITEISKATGLTIEEIQSL